jgi:hypothetical protein
MTADGQASSIIDEACPVAFPRVGRDELPNRQTTIMDLFDRGVIFDPQLNTAAHTVMKERRNAIWR